MLKVKIIIIAAICFITVINYSSFAQQKVSWNGYLQYRFSDNYLNQTDFLVRRAKFWINGLLPDGGDHWSYKVQANFQQQNNFQLLLQDALINYAVNNFTITAGQFVPNFSIQRKQPDYMIPLVERAGIVNALVPGAETMARDIGIEIKYNNKKFCSFSLGFFNGNGANTISNKKNFLFVNRGGIFIIKNKNTKFELGYNLSYRNAHSIRLDKIFGSNYTFTGNDFRFGFECKLNIGNFKLQSEYIQANLGAERVQGYYALADYLFASKNLLAFSIEQYGDLNPLTVDDPWYVIGYSYLLKGNNIKFSLDNKIQFAPDRTNSLTSLQVQYFFN